MNIDLMAKVFSSLIIKKKKTVAEKKSMNQVKGMVRFFIALDLIRLTCNSKQL